MDEKLERIGIGEAEKISIRRFEKDDAQKQAITLLGKRVIEQGTIEKYCNSSKDYDIRKTSL